MSRILSVQMGMKDFFSRKLVRRRNSSWLRGGRRGCTSTYIMYSIRTFARIRKWSRSMLSAAFSAPGDGRVESIVYESRVPLSYRAFVARVYACTVPYGANLTWRSAYLGENIAFRYQLSTFRYAFTIFPACTEKFAILNGGPAALCHAYADSRLRNVFVPE